MLFSNINTNKDTQWHTHALYCTQGIKQAIVLNYIYNHQHKNHQTLWEI